MSCEHIFNYDWVTGEILFEWLLPLDEYHGPQGPWWQCISCDKIFYSATMCCEPCCNPFSGYCRTCSP